MNTATPDPSSLESRLARAESRLRRLSALTVFLILGFVLLLAWQLAPKGPILQAQGFELRDSRLVRRASLALREDGSPALRINNARGRARAMLNVANDGAVFLRLSDSLGYNRAYLALAPNGTPRLTLAGPDGRTLVALEAMDGVRPLVTLRDSAQRVVWSAP